MELGDSILIPSLQEALRDELKRILGHGEAFGLYGMDEVHTTGWRRSASVSAPTGLSRPGEFRTTTADVFHAVLLNPRWRWIGEGDVVDVLSSVDGIENRNGVIFYGSSFSHQCTTGAFCGTQPVGGEVYWPEPCPQLNESLMGEHGHTHMYKLFPSLDVALLVEANRTVATEGHRLRRAAVDDLCKLNWDLARLDSGIILVDVEPTNLGTPVSADEYNERHAKLFFAMTLHESLFLNDAGHRANALRWLFENQEQASVEEALLPYLQAGDREVRMNAASALAYPAYSVPLQAAISIPQWRSGVAERRMGDAATRAILDLVAREADSGVLDYALCALKVQNYQGEDVVLLKKIYATVQQALPRVTDHETMNDTLDLLERLRTQISS